MHRNYYFLASCQNSDITFRFSDNDVLKRALIWWSDNVYRRFITVQIDDTGPFHLFTHSSLYWNDFHQLWTQSNQFLTYKHKGMRIMSCGLNKSTQELRPLPRHKVCLLWPNPYYTRNGLLIWYGLVPEQRVPVQAQRVMSSAINSFRPLPATVCWCSSAIFRVQRQIRHVVLWRFCE